MGKNDLDKPARKVLNYLQRFGKVKYYHYNFEGVENNERPNYACIIIDTDDRIAKGLESSINSELNEVNGFRARMRFIALSEINSKGVFKYAAEIVPYEGVDRSDWKDATDDFLKSLPHAIRNFAIKNNCRDRLNGER